MPPDGKLSNGRALHRQWVLLPQQQARRTPQRPARNRLPLPQQSAPWTPQRRKVERTEVPEHRDSQREAPVACEAGREEPFDELSAWIFSPTLTRHSHLIPTLTRHRPAG